MRFNSHSQALSTARFDGFHDVFGKVIVCVLSVCVRGGVVHVLDFPDVCVQDLAFADGSHPSKDVVQRWVSLVKSVFKSNKDATIGVHCVAGLGRAPVLVWINVVFILALAFLSCPNSHLALSLPRFASLLLVLPCGMVVMS